MSRVEAVPYLPRSGAVFRVQGRSRPRGILPGVIGRYPTPVKRASSLSTDRCELWVKRDDLTHEAYGGNKVRKLEHILERARERSARRIITFGAAGSHHVLATTLHGRRACFDVAAILTPQPRSEHAIRNLRIALSLGLEPVRAPSMALAPVLLLTAMRQGDFVVGPGGSTVDGTLGYVDAAWELAQQIDDGVLPVPDAIVVALGSAGTAAGLLAGMGSCKPKGGSTAAPSLLETRLVAVRIVSPALMGRKRALLLARRAAHRRQLAVSWDDLAARFVLEPDFLGAGYAHATSAGDHATKVAQREGLTLDPTYTAKAFAAVLDLMEKARYPRILYWHTLSSAPLEPMLAKASQLPAELDRLFTA
jgi:1-aminocyclopropane-1-carboxylate deaminase/D-cysteine desulfhydrase-like pyridoxal-dependent ACC family enzyme